MTLKQCTKEELLFVIEHIQTHYMFNLSYYINRALSELEYQRQMKKIDEADKYAKLSYEKMNEYAQLLKPYEGKKVVEIPLDIIKKADRLLKEAREADKKYTKLMDIQ